MSEEKYVIICRECNAKDTIRSDERVYCTYRVYACDPDVLNYASESQKVYDSTIEDYFCTKCNRSFTEDEVIDMISEEEE